MNGSISLISLNIEGSKHLDRILPFLEKERPDVFCAQELFEPDINIFAKLFPGGSFFAPMARWGREGFVGESKKGKGNPETLGVGIFSALPAQSNANAYYRGDSEALPEHIAFDGTTMNRVLASLTIEKNAAVFTVATTHFTWSKDGQFDMSQQEDLPVLLAALEKMPEFILAGDLNAPRGGEVFQTIAARYRDNIPPEYSSSLDPALHRVGYLQRMVDGLFTTPQYTVEGTKLVEGLSDHMAIVSRVRRAP